MIRPFAVKYIAVLFLCICFDLTKAQEGATRYVHADMKQAAGKKNRAYSECIGAGRANEGLRADWQEQLAMLQKDVHFKYIRFHGLLHDDMRVYSIDKAGNPVYNFQYVDKLFDFLQRIHIRPFVEFSFMPADMAAGTKTIFWWKANVSKPKSYAQWDTLIVKLVKHWQQRYGEEEVKKWYFEVWNEPDLRGFFDGSQADYFELYAHTARAVKSVSSAYRVGGPATSAVKWIADFLSYCERDKLPLDFVSTHDYGTTSVLDEMGTKKQQLKNIRDTLAIDVKRVRNTIDASSYKNAELHFTEWNTSPSSRDPIHDTYQNAAYILHVLKKASAYSNSMSYWTFTDIFEEAGPGPTPFHGGFGLINLQGIKKPGYHAYRFIEQLGETELKNEDESSWICRSENGVQALIWDYTQPSAGYTYNQNYFNRLQAPAGKRTVRLRISNLEKGRYQVEEYRLGYGQNDPYTAYLKMGSPTNLSPSEVSILKQGSAGLPLRKLTLNLKAGTYEQPIELHDNEIVLIKLTRHL
ncbi:xylan 1,4-beta-xylosidase [Pedobacter africanus]|uniref:Xylan 1,4-beta-xylosidase n=1 Tax=Pedobacter africanus TaxID=151894 RepID=A0ACC6KVR8_9SPHI|nr:glycoside hydrolase [Pedobacter africanus]MDR6783239.1 xylan 1,4-beta-xylosidase [Pedobacter africanus]